MMLKTGANNFQFQPTRLTAIQDTGSITDEIDDGSGGDDGFWAGMIGYCRVFSFISPSFYLHRTQGSLERLELSWSLGR